MYKPTLISADAHPLQILSGPLYARAIAATRATAWNVITWTSASPTCTHATSVRGRHARTQ